MDVIEMDLPGVLLIRPREFRDDRGSFLEVWHKERYKLAGISGEFVQDNVAVSRGGVIRGLHYQHPNPQGKLVMVLSGAVLDVAVDIRRESPTFGQWVSASLSAENSQQLWIPAGFAHGYAVLSETVIFAYKCTRLYDPSGDAAIRFDDPDIGIRWGISNPMLSSKDLAAPSLREVPPERLPGLF
jgi:dTDP-4-dehydrorhamnose 3,5-epimerase